ncbi:uncharacterized protein B0T23DRAFT_388515 [Neurospora hispaniola]|uniref:Uncharacterized protein n=1 Tax=Neurospora hispaniola TaxID=588809 RepID=A0AAJ0MMY9_9PEZI|nr:hypothetical protein B0T23DRAFT_388515 [Neurospora hispaniola]
MRVHMVILAPCLPSGCIGRGYHDGCVTEQATEWWMIKAKGRPGGIDESTFMSVRQASHRAIRRLMSLRCKGSGGKSWHECISMS